MEKKNKVCCDAFDKMDIKWMHLEDGGKVLPHIEGKSDTNKYRVNYCPSCGANIIGIIIKPNPAKEISTILKYSINT
jgi:hypothetical protein